MDAIRLDATTAKVLAIPATHAHRGVVVARRSRYRARWPSDWGESGLTSYHVRRLADAGFVEPDDEQAAVGRERWWRARTR